MNGSPSGSAVAPKLAPAKPKARGFLRIARHGAGPGALYVVTYRRLDREGALPKPATAQGASALIELLERIGVDVRLREVRYALEDILRFGSANIPDLRPSHEER